jgi:hypothetical protein
MFSESVLGNILSCSIKTKSEKNLQLLAETVAQCRQISQLDAGDWQEIAKTVCRTDLSVKSAAICQIKTGGFCQRVRFIFDTLRQCIQLIYTEPIVGKIF